MAGPRAVDTHVDPQQRAEWQILLRPLDQGILQGDLECATGNGDPVAPTAVPCKLCRPRQQTCPRLAPELEFRGVVGKCSISKNLEHRSRLDLVAPARRDPGDSVAASLDENQDFSVAYQHRIGPSDHLGGITRGRWYVEPGFGRSRTRGEDLFSGPLSPISCTTGNTFASYQEKGISPAF